MGFLLIIVLVVFCLGAKILHVTALFDKAHVKIENRFTKPRPVSFHCKTSYEDLGWQQLADKAAFEWEFRVNGWSTTLFWCEFQWDYNLPNNKKTPVKGGFDIYTVDRDRDGCGQHCRWVVEERGVFSLNVKTREWERVDGWPMTDELWKGFSDAPSAL